MSFSYGVSSVVPNFVQSNGLKMLSRKEDFENRWGQCGEREGQSTLLCFMQLEREPVVTFFEARSRGGTGSKMSGEITRQSRLECHHVKTDRSIEKSEQSEIDPNGRFKG